MLQVTCSYDNSHIVAVTSNNMVRCLPVLYDPSQPSHHFPIAPTQPPNQLLLLLNQLPELCWAILLSTQPPYHLPIFAISTSSNLINTLWPLHQLALPSTSLCYAHCWHYIISLVTILQHFANKSAYNQQVPRH